MRADVSCDFETRSQADLRRCGVYRYAAHPSTDVWCFSFYDPEQGAILTWRPGDTDSTAERLRELAANPTCIFRAWNAQFERIVWRTIMVRRYGFPDIALERWRCTAAEAAALSLPRSLDNAARVLGVSEQKDKAGHNLMMRMSRPRTVLPGGTLVWWDDPERVQRLIDYNRQDVRTEMAVKALVSDLPPKELATYQLDQRINDRGLMLDVDLTRAVRTLAITALQRTNSELAEVTNGRVAGVTKRGDLVAFLRAEGVEVDSIAASNVRSLLASDDLPAAARRALQLRADAAKSSVAKTDAMLACADPHDHRMRGLMLYHGAGTGRWAGKLVQPHNFPARSKALGAAFKIDPWLPYIRALDYERIDLCHPPLEVLAQALRPCLRAAPGHRFVCADFAAIEARVLAWLADETWLLSAFSDGRDTYRLMASAIYGLPPDQIDKASAERDMGKRVVLGCGFGMGARKFRLTCARDGVEVSEAEAQQIIDTYRSRNARIVDLWYEVERAAVAAVRTPGKDVFAADGRLKFTRRGEYLWIVLPSRRRALAYFLPRLVPEMTPWGAVRDTVQFWGEVGPARTWAPVGLYGGLIVENIVQAVARDLMVDAMFRVEAAGYPLVLTVHDELLCEVPDGFGDLAEFERLVATTEDWAQGCPVRAEGWTGPYYRK